MKKSILIIVILLFNITKSIACLNYYYSIDNQGHLHAVDDLDRPFNTNFNLKLNERRLKKLKVRLKTENDYKLLSDYAVLLLNTGKTKVALEILIQLSKHYPNEYQIAANLGTAYELSGDNQKALQYIKRGIELNPDSHQGSEWVHLKILEAKLQIANDTSYLSNNTVLNLTNENKRDSLVRNQILIQVRERFPFSPAPNKIMASLLIDLGDCFSNSASIEFAKVLYTIAKLHYDANPGLVDTKIKDMVRLRNKYAHVKPEKRKGRGENAKMTGINYKKMLDDNNTINHKIKWENILIDVEQLLFYVNFEKIEPVISEIKQEEKDTTNHKLELKKAGINKAKVEKNDSPTDETHNLKYLAIGIIALMILIFLIYRKR